MGRLGMALVVLTLALLPGAALSRAPGHAVASWYGAWEEGRLMANGHRFHAHALTAASRKLPLGTRVRLVNLANGRSVVVRITDRGPYVLGRDIDVSKGAAERLHMVSAGLAAVRLELHPSHRKLRTRHVARWPAACVRRPI